MPADIQTSFIPKKPVQEAGVKRRTSGTGVITLIAFVIFVLALASAGGVFLYERFLTSAIEKKEVDLERIRGSLEPETIEDLSRIDEKLSLGSSVLASHVAFSSLFELLEDLTLKSVQFTEFSLEETSDGISVHMSGAAESFGTVALQSDSFGGSRYLRNVIFSDVNTSEQNNIAFAVDFELSSEYFTYQAQLARNK